ncbi:MAG: hypothetical protein ACYDAG_18000 [Chloroflexota bacterium]
MTVAPGPRAYLAQLDERGWLTHIRREVSGGIELAALLHQLQTRGQAAMFERVWTPSFRVIGNLIVNRDMLALALGCGRDETQRAWLSKLHERIDPVLAPDGPVKEVVVTGQAASISDLPIVQH